MLPRRYARLLIGMGLIVGLFSSRDTQAQFAVEDVYVGAQTFITAINSARAVVQEGVQIANQAEMIKNQIEMLAYAAAHLTKSPFQIVNQLSGLMGRYEAILQRADGIGFQLEAISTRFDSLYGVVGEPVAHVQNALDQLAGLTHEVRRASLTAMLSQAIHERLAAQRAHMQQALLESDASAGHLAAIQNTNQILGILIEQQASMQQLSAAGTRAQIAMTMAQAAASEQARQLAAQATETWGQMEEVHGLGVPDFQ